MGDEVPGHSLLTLAPVGLIPAKRYLCQFDRDERGIGEEKEAVENLTNRTFVLRYYRKEELQGHVGLQQAVAGPAFRNAKKQLPEQNN